MFNQKIKIMKKTLLLGTALMVGVAGFAQNAATKAINPKYLQKKSIFAQGKIATETQPTTAAGIKVSKKGANSTMAGCTNQMSITTSYNCFGVGGGLNTSDQNCLSYNKDLNSLVWTQRGSKTWALNTTSGFIQATIINAATLALDSVILYKDGGNNYHGRYPSGTFLNPIGNTNYHNAMVVAFGQVTDGSNWTGTAYTAKPLWSVSAMTHVAPTGDSLYAAAPATFGYCAASNLSAAAASDVQALSDGKTVVSLGTIGDPSFTATDNSPVHKGLFVKSTIDATGKIVNRTIDTTSLTPNVRKGLLGYNLDKPRMAFGPDGLHGYVVFTGRLADNYCNYSDSTMTPIVYKTTDGGTTWNQILAGYDWTVAHPEVKKNVGELTGDTRYYTFDAAHGVDLTVDANNVLHYVSTVSSSTFKTGDIDSLGIYSPVYSYDYVNHHPIIWDFMTDGTCWKTMMVDSIITALCSSSSTDTTSTHSAMGGATILGVGAHIQVSRSTDGTKVFYGWADSDPNITGTVYNTNPDILMKALDVNTNMITATKNATGGLGTCFYPFLADQSYSDGAGGWIVPAVYTVGHIVTAQTPQVTYDASSQADYIYTNCGSFAPADFSIAAPINVNAGGGCSTGTICYVGVKTNNTFASSISNYPNPFNGTTTIAVTLSENKAFNVNVYNAIGTLVYSKKVNGNVGENAVSFDGSALSSGVYYYTVTAGNQQATKKMIIQK
jgi:hypothetical protein